MCTDLAAANCYKIDHLKQPSIWSLVEQAKVYYVGGYHLTVCVPAIMALAEEAAAKDKACQSTTCACWFQDADRSYDRSLFSAYPHLSSLSSSRISLTKPRRIGTMSSETRPKRFHTPNPTISIQSPYPRLPEPWLPCQRRTRNASGRSSSHKAQTPP